MSVARKYHQSMVHYIRKTVAYNEITDETAFDIGVIPEGSIIYDAGVIVSTAFNSATSDTLDIGPSTDTNGLATLLDLTTAGRIVADELATSDDLGPLSSDTTFQAVWNGTGTAPSAGSITVYVAYMPNLG